MPGSCFKFPAKSHNLKAVLVFIDFKQAFGSVHRGRMPQILRAYDIPEKLIDAIGHFRVPKNLTFKTRLSAKPLF